MQEFLTWWGNEDLVAIDELKVSLAAAGGAISFVYPLGTDGLGCWRV